MSYASSLRRCVLNIQGLAAEEESHSMQARQTASVEFSLFSSRRLARHYGPGLVYHYSAEQGVGRSRSVLQTKQILNPRDSAFAFRKEFEALNG